MDCQKLTAVSLFAGMQPEEIDTATANAIKDEYIEASVGLPMAGELFCANDIDLSTSNVKTFVDINTIENPTITSHYWTMNRYDLSNVRSVEWDGSFNKYSNSISNGVRPVIFLKNNLNFNGGNGTAQFPYTLS